MIIQYILVDISGQTTKMNLDSLQDVEDALIILS
jgi:hypothetical protein